MEVQEEYGIYSVLPMLQNHGFKVEATHAEVQGDKVNVKYNVDPKLTDVFDKVQSLFDHNKTLADSVLLELLEGRDITEKLAVYNETYDANLSYILRDVEDVPFEDLKKCLKHYVIVIYNHDAGDSRRRISTIAVKTDLGYERVRGLHHATEWKGKLARKIPDALRSRFQDEFSYKTSAPYTNECEVLLSNDTFVKHLYLQIQKDELKGDEAKKLCERLSSGLSENGLVAHLIASTF